MNQHKAQFINFLNANGIKWEDNGKNDSNMLKIKYGGTNLSVIEVAVIFNVNNENRVSIVNWQLGNCKGREIPAYTLCNELNKGNGLIKLYVDDDSDITCQYDIPWTGAGFEMRCYNAVQRVVATIDMLYPGVMDFCQHYGV